MFLSLSPQLQDSHVKPLIHRQRRTFCALIISLTRCGRSCQSNKAPHYLADSCTLVSNIASRQRLRSARRRHLDVPRHNRRTWPSVIFCRRSYRLEFASRRAPRSKLYRRHIQTVAEDIPFRAALVCRAR